MSASDHVQAPLDRLRPPGSDPRPGDRPVTDRPVADRPGLDPLASFAFWGHEDTPRRRPATLAWFDRIRGDARVGVAALLACALVAGLVWYRVGVGGAGASESSGAARTAAEATRTSASASTTRPSNATSSATGAATRAKGGSTELVVHVAGAVVRPGIVRLRTGARVVDAIEAAGGARPEADLDQLNLAAKVADGQRIGVGIPGRPATAVGATGAAAAGSTDGSTGSGTGLLNLNTATQAEIEALPGIGPVLGAAILRERDERGGFRSVDELRSVRGIGEMRFADLRDLVTV